MFFFFPLLQSHHHPCRGSHHCPHSRGQMENHLPRPSVIVGALDSVSFLPLQKKHAPCFRAHLSAPYPPPPMFSECGRSDVVTSERGDDATPTTAGRYGLRKVGYPVCAQRCMTLRSVRSRASGLRAIASTRNFSFPLSALRCPIPRTHYNPPLF